jgi:hypothetical protein
MGYTLRELARMPRFWIGYFVFLPIWIASFMLAGYISRYSITAAILVIEAICLPTMLAVRFFVRGSIS